MFIGSYKYLCQGDTENLMRDLLIRKMYPPSKVMYDLGPLLDA